jgi:Protein of unknown function DUF262
MTTESFGARLLTLPHIFENRFFIIPDYQRGYAWGKKQVEDLLKDIEHLTNDTTTLRHYTGTLVLSQPANAKANEYHVVDGQQRLTTMVILLRMLRERLASDEHDDFTARYLRRGTQGRDSPVLRLNADTRLFFERVVLGDGNHGNMPADLEAHKRLLAARGLIGDWLATSSKSASQVAVVRSVIETKLGFLVYAPEEDGETGIMFEVINNRGKPLSELEKVKNYLIYCSAKLSAPTLRDEINADWSVILRHLNVAKKVSAADEAAFLRYCVTVHFKANKTDSNYGYDELRKKIAIDVAMKDGQTREIAIKKISIFVQFLKDAALWYERLYAQNHQDLERGLQEKLNQILAQTTHASIMPIFLALVIKLKSGERLVSLLALLEILNFRVYMARNMTGRTDSGQGDLYYFASRYYHDNLLVDRNPDERKFGKRTMESEDDALEFYLLLFAMGYAKDEWFRASFELAADNPADFYKWGGLRYFLMSYEVKLQPNKSIAITDLLIERKDGKTADYLSLEHLWATENRNLEGENNRAQDKFEKRRLGNFVLLELRLNIQGSNESLAEKLPRYLDGFDEEPPTDFAHIRKMAKDVKDILALPATERRTKNYWLDFYRELNNRQEARFIKFAEERWSLERFLGYQQISKNLRLADEGEG